MKVGKKQQFDDALIGEDDCKNCGHAGHIHYSQRPTDGAVVVLFFFF